MNCEIARKEFRVNKIGRMNFRPSILMLTDIQRLLRSELSALCMSI